MDVAAAPRWWVAAAIARRDAASMLCGIGVYVTLALAVVAAAWLLLIDVRALAAGGLLVMADPFGSPLAVAMLVLALFLSVSAAVSVARDRASGTLEVLFYGPVDELAYVLGKIGGLLITWLAALPLLLASLILLALITGFALTPSVLVSLPLSVIPAAELVGFSVLLSLGMDRVRNAVLLLVGVIALMFGATLAHRMVLLVPVSDPSSPVLALRDALGALDAGIRWVSPFAYLERVVEGTVAGAWWPAVASLALAAACTAFMIGLGAYWLRHRGVYRRGD
jgi:ABC-type transport system involved in multi-copper enzyme maturation permease subunit